MRKLLVALLITLVIGMVFAASENNSGYVVKAQVPNPVKIMPLGDSITEGWNGTEGVGGYRTSLYSDLVNNGFHVDFVGSQKNGTGLDNDNEGHVAYSTAEIMDDVTGWLMSNPADVVLLHIGTNDIQTTQNVSLIVTKVEGILDNIDQWGSNNGRNVTVVIARIILRSDSVSWNTTTKSYNDALQAMVSTRIANGHRLIMVDMEHALTYPTDLIIADGVHPTPIGYEKMATVWYNALTSLLSYSLTVNSAHGLVTKLPDQILYPYGTTVNLSVSAADGWTFYAWSGDLTSSNNPETIIMNANKTVTATFTQNQFQLTMVTNFGSVSPVSGNWYDSGSSVTIYSVSPGVGVGERYVWNGWTGSGSGSYTGLANNTNLVVMNGPVTETASWTHQFYLTVSSPYGDTGGEGWYDAGSFSYATISSTIATGSGGAQYTFSGWSGGASGSSSTSNIIVMDGPKTAIANWSPVPTATPKPTPTPTHRPTATPTTAPTLNPTVSPSFSPSPTPPSLSPTNVPILNANTLVLEVVVLGVVLIGGTVGIFVLRKRKTSKKTNIYF